MFVQMRLAMTKFSTAPTMMRPALWPYWNSRVRCLRSVVLSARSTSSHSAAKKQVVILEHHAAADAAFLQDAHVQPLARYATAAGDIAWVASESEVHVNKDGKTAVLLSTETMVLKREQDVWRIEHIHWSSRTKKQ